MPKNSKHTRRPSVRNQMSHAEIMDKRYQKRKKKEKTYEGFVGSKHYHLTEYMKLTDKEEVSKKSVARSIMDIVEEINDGGMNNKRYLDIMDQLMSLHNEDDRPINPYNNISLERSLDNDTIGRYGMGGSGVSYTYLRTYIDDMREAYQLE
jgi:hypothetical protein